MLNFQRLITKSNPLSFSKNYIKTSITFNFTSKKFHELANKMQRDELVFKIPEDNILTKYLQDLTPKRNTNSQSTAWGKNTKTALTQTNSQKVNYKQLLSENSRGSVITQKYKQAELCLTGMNYTNVSYDNIYKSILKFQPDCIVVQQRPDSFCENFQVIKKNPETDTFSDRLYVEQLNLDKSFGLKKNFTEENILQLEQSIFPRKAQHSRPQQDEFFPFLRKQIVNQKPLVASIYNFLKKGAPIYLGQLPETVSRELLANSHSLMQLQQLFKITAKSMPLYPGIKNLTPMQLCAYLFPQQFLAMNDKYMATLVQVMISVGYKRVMLLSGVASNQAVWQILSKGHHVDSQQQITPLINYLIPPQIKGSIIRDYDPLQIIEKHILIDALYHGSQFKDVKINEFRTTNKIIAKYGVGQAPQMMFKFRYEMSLRYSQLLEECIMEGENRKKKEFMRQAMRE